MLSPRRGSPRSSFGVRVRVVSASLDIPGANGVVMSPRKESPRSSFEFRVRVEGASLDIPDANAVPAGRVPWLDPRSKSRLGWRARRSTPQALMPSPRRWSPRSSLGVRVEMGSASLDDLGGNAVPAERAPQVPARGQR